MTPTLQLVLAGGGLVALAALGACAAQRARAERARDGDEGTVSMSTSATTTTGEVPPLDVAARHVRFQTATFALG